MFQRKIALNRRCPRPLPLHYIRHLPYLPPFLLQSIFLGQRRSMIICLLFGGSGSSLTNVTLINDYFVVFRGYRDRHDDDRGGSRGFSSYEPARDRDRGAFCLFFQLSRIADPHCVAAILPSSFGDAVWYGVVDPDRNFDPLFCSKFFIQYPYRTESIAQWTTEMAMLTSSR